MAPDARVWLVLASDPYQYQGRHSVRGVFSSEPLAEALMAELLAADDDDDVFSVVEYDVEGPPTD